MMQPLTAGGLGKAFRGSTDAVTYQRLLVRQQDEQRLRRERRDDGLDDNAELLDFALAVITASEAAEFRVELGVYETATVSALQQNDMALDQIRAKLDPLLAKAHVMPDGRRVFKTQDGLRVFDEHGQELDAETINPEDIADYRPRWEEAEPTITEYNLLLEQRAEILAYQEKLDEAREHVDSGKMTRDEYDELREKLKNEMPEAVRVHVPGMDVVSTTMENAPAAQAETLDIGGDVVPAAFTSSMFNPS